jgi:DNA-binding transcriptional MerR regulator
MARSSKLIAKVAARLEPIMNFEPIEERSSYTIGQLSSHLRVSLRTLRFYEQTGLLAPDREGLRRLYSRDDLERLDVIVMLRELEVSLTAIKTLMAAIDGDGRTSEREVMAQVEIILTGLASENLDRIAELQRINARIDDARRNLGAE